MTILAGTCRRQTEKLNPEADGERPSSCSAVIGIAMPRERRMDEDQIPRKLPAPSRAERNIARASKELCVSHSVLGIGAGVRIQAESHPEHCHYLVLNADRSIVDLQEQVGFPYGAHDEREHVFDFVATRTSGSWIAYTIKPEVRLRSGRFLAEMQTVAWWVRHNQFADDVRLLTDGDLDDVEFHNAKVIAAVRDPDPAADTIARNGVAAITGAITLRDLTIATGLEARGGPPPAGTARSADAADLRPAEARSVMGKDFDSLYHQFQIREHDRIIIAGAAFRVVQQGADAWLLRPTDGKEVCQTLPFARVNPRGTRIRPRPSHRGDRPIFGARQGEPPHRARAARHPGRSMPGAVRRLPIDGAEGEPCRAGANCATPSTLTRAPGATGCPFRRRERQE